MGKVLCIWKNVGQSDTCTKIMPTGMTLLMEGSVRQRSFDMVCWRNCCFYDF